jgi:hypothetical protein
MNTKSQQSRVAAKYLKTALLVAAAAYGAGAVGLGGFALSHHLSAVGAVTAAKEKRKQIEEQTEIVEKARLIALSAEPKDLRALTRFQSLVEQLATRSNCQLTEFRTAAGEQPYSTKYGSSENEDGWNQIEINLSLTGELRSVLDTVRALAEQDVAVEFVLLDLTRESALADRSLVTAKLTLMVLVQQGSDS